MDKPTIEGLDQAHAREAAELLGEAMRSNPTHIAVFEGDDAPKVRAQKALFETMLSHMPGEVLVARRDGDLVGVMRMVEWPQCFPPPEAWEGVTAQMQGVVGEWAPRVVEWLKTWSESEPKEPHWHLGPVAVKPDSQGQGIGSSLVEEFCRRTEAAGVAGYLETDKPENVRLYERFGFQTVGQVPVLGANNWLMLRPAS